MSKPRDDEPTPSKQLAHFTDRDDLRACFFRHFESATEPPVLAFYGIGGTGKTWLLNKLRSELPFGFPSALLDLDARTGGQRFVMDPAQALFAIRGGFGAPTPRFDLAYATMLHKEGIGAEPGFIGHRALSPALDVVGEVSQWGLRAAGLFTPPATNVAIGVLSAALIRRIKDTKLSEFLHRASGNEFLLSLRSRSAQEIEQELMRYLVEDLKETLDLHLHHAVGAVIFFDSFEAVTAGLQNPEHRRFREQWFQKMSSYFDFALVVIAGQNRIDWDDADPRWADRSVLDQHLVGGLSEHDSRQFLTKCGITRTDLQDAILATSLDSEESGYHCFSLGLCADTVHKERQSGRETDAEGLRLRPQDWEELARRFLKSLATDEERRWITRLCVTPRFDEVAARVAFSATGSAAQDAAWEGLPDYSFVEPLAGSLGWFAIRYQMHRAVLNQPSEHGAVERDHEFWSSHWQRRSDSPTDEFGGLAWYHRYSLDPESGLEQWRALAEGARKALPPRMQEHWALIGWWNPVELPKVSIASEVEAYSAYFLGGELYEASIGNRATNIERAIAYYSASLSAFTDLTPEWAMTQNGLGRALAALPTGNKNENLRKAISHYEAALKTYTEKAFPFHWAGTQNNLGVAYSDLRTQNPTETLTKAISYFEAALRIRTANEIASEWAMTQVSLGAAYQSLPTGDPAENSRKAILCYEAALTVYTEEQHPSRWAGTQNSLGNVLVGLATEDRAKNLTQAIAHYEAALRVDTEQNFPRAWAGTLSNLGVAYSDLRIGNRAENLAKAIGLFQTSLGVLTEKDFPRDWALTQNNLGNAYRRLPTDDRVKKEENLKKAIGHFEAAMTVYNEEDFPDEWAMTKKNLGNAYRRLPTNDRMKNEENLKKAIGYFEAALRVYTARDFPTEFDIVQRSLAQVRVELSQLR